METPQKQLCSPAILLFCCSTMHHNNNIENNGKPKIVNFYNETKASVNALDQKVRHYTTYRKTSRWCMAVFYNVMDISAYNAFVLYKLRPPLQQRLPNYQKRLKFLMTLGESLIMPNMLVRASHINGFHKSTLTAMDAFGVKPTVHETANTRKQADPEGAAPKKRRCHVCPRSTDREVKQHCFACKLHKCGEHLTKQLVCHECSSDTE